VELWDNWGTGGRGQWVNQWSVLHWTVVWIRYRLRRARACPLQGSCQAQNSHWLLSAHAVWHSRYCDSPMDTQIRYHKKTHQSQSLTQGALRKKWLMIEIARWMFQESCMHGQCHHFYVRLECSLVKLFAKVHRLCRVWLRHRCQQSADTGCYCKLQRSNKLHSFRIREIPRVRCTNPNWQAHLLGQRSRCFPCRSTRSDMTANADVSKQECNCGTS
jgi:hypothetical protein